MRINEFTAIATPRVLLVPYEKHHVEKYHSWMEDAAIREATASEQLTLEEEYENQQSWRTSHDKLTFIICHPLAQGDPNAEKPLDKAHDLPERTVGDVNFFLYPWEGETRQAEGDPTNDAPKNDTDQKRYCVGEVDVMIAGQADQGKGLGKAAVLALIDYVLRNSAAILDEYVQREGPADAEPPVLELLMVKIGQQNERSIALFKSLGFKQQGDADYFGEIRLLLTDLDSIRSSPVEGYAELPYQAP